MNLIKINESGLKVVIDISKEGKARLIHFSEKDFDENSYNCDDYHKYYTMLELHCTGEDINSHHGSRYTYTSPGDRLGYVSHEITQNQAGQKLELVLREEKLEVRVHYQFYRSASVLRAWNEVKNISDQPVTLEYISSFAYYGLSHGCQNWETGSYLYIGHNTWHGELQWRKNTPWELGLSKLNNSSLKRLSYAQVGSWSSAEYLPMAIFENAKDESCIFWQIEHNGSWYWEMTDVPDGGLYLQAGGPNNNQHHFRKTIGMGESFVTVPVSVGVAENGFDGVIGELTKYRRLIRRQNEDNEELPVIFNDYMNCLMGDPTTEKLIPLIDAASQAGCEYFVIDAGWYAGIGGGDEAWWDSIGLWEESAQRFPTGLNSVMDYIRSHNMKPGLWVEIEGIGPDCPLVKKLPESCFFQRDGHLVKEHSRYQLDFRSPIVREYATNTLERLINKYQLKYFKIDYNINIGIGTDYQTESAGTGLLEHNRAYLAWLDEFFERHPEVVIENCASGGQRMDYAMLQRISIQSTSDQTDYRQYASISAMAPSAVTPEQAAVWSYPHYENDEEEVIFNMINAMLGRVHQSGFLNKLREASFSRVKEGIACYKSIRQDIKVSYPVFPLGLISLNSPWSCGGLVNDQKLYLSVWRKGASEDTIDIPLNVLKGKQVEITIKYPAGIPVKYHYDARNSVLTVTLPQVYCARLFEFDIKNGQ